MSLALIVAHDEAFAPLAFVTEGRSDGVAIAMLRAACTMADIELRLAPRPFAELSASVAAGDADAVFPFAIGAGRAASHRFSVPFLETGAALFGLIGRPVPAAASLVGRRVATPGAGPLVGRIPARFPGALLLETRDYRDTLQAVVDGRADVAALNRHVGHHLAGVWFPGRFAPPAEPFLRLDLALALPADRDARALPAIDAAVARLKADGTFDLLAAALAP